MYETPERALFTTGDVKKKAQRRREAPTWLQESLLTIKRKPEFALTDRQFAKCARVCAERNAKVEVSRVGKRLQMWQAAGRAHEWVCGWKGGGGGGAAERRQVGWSVTASHWCALSYVGINHDSEMTYFLTPQTNSTFNRSQGLCQTTFSPRSLSKVASGRVGLPRHNAEDVRFLSQAPSAALL